MRASDANADMVATTNVEIVQMIIEWKPARGIWVLFPTVVVFQRGSDPLAPSATVVTLAWLCGGVSVVWE